MANKPLIYRVGTIDFNVVEVTPVVFGGKLYRFESINRKYHHSRIPNSYFRLIDVAADRIISEFALDFHLGSAHVQDDVMYAYGIPGYWGADQIHVFWSGDLETWHSSVALHMPAWELYNTSVCKGPDGYMMSFEVGAPPEIAGEPFTVFFASSDDLRHWKCRGTNCAFGKDRYTGCPTLRYHDGWFYMMYLERHGPAQRDYDHTVFDTHIVRTNDFVNWQTSPLNPFLAASPDDRRIRSNHINSDQTIRIAAAPNVNTSDLDLCEHEGNVVIYYNWGSQKGIEYLAEARFDGTLGDLLSAFFPSKSSGLHRS